MKKYKIILTDALGRNNIPDTTIANDIATFEMGAIIANSLNKIEKDQTKYYRVVAKNFPLKKIG